MEIFVIFSSLHSLPSAGFTQFKFDGLSFRYLSLGLFDQSTPRDEVQVIHDLK